MRRVHQGRPREIVQTVEFLTHGGPLAEAVSQLGIDPKTLAREIDESWADQKTSRTGGGDPLCPGRPR